MVDIARFGQQDQYPLVNYVKRNLWSNPSSDLQFQVRLKRVSQDLGYIGNFDYMGYEYLCPDDIRFWNVFTMGLLDPRVMNLFKPVIDWVPFNRWTKASDIMEKRGVFLDFYNGVGLRYNTSNTYIMKCFNGTTLFAFAKTPAAYPMPVKKSMYMHCYTPSTLIYREGSYPDKDAGYQVRGLEAGNFRDWDALNLWYNEKVALGKGIVIAFHNGKLKTFSSIVPALGDLVECVYDPTVYQRIKYDYNQVDNYYSERDGKRKFLLFPWMDNIKQQYYYFDDCRFYIWNERRGYGYYFHRNSADAVRQLTHQDYGIAADYVDSLVTLLINEDTTGLTTKDDIKIIVDYVNTTYLNFLGPNSSRISELYLLEDPTKIIKAMTGVNSTVEEWEARNLERSPHNTLLATEDYKLTNELSFEALGYNGASCVLSNPLFHMPGILPTHPDYQPGYQTAILEGGDGYRIPASYRQSGSVYEYDQNGLFLRAVGFIGRDRYLPNTDAVFCEFMMGLATNRPNGTLTKNTIVVSKEIGFRVYRAPWKLGGGGGDDPGFWDSEWSISKDGLPFVAVDNVVTLPVDPDDPPLSPRPWDGGEIAGDWVDITDTDLYSLDKESGTITWNFSMINFIGLVLHDDKHLLEEVEISHVDNSITLDMSQLWKLGDYPLPLRPYQLELIYNKKKTLIENVDYVLDYPTIVFVGKELLDEGNTHNVLIRASGLTKEGPYPRSELGFVADGVIGYNGRYNVRVNRPTKLVSKGRILLTTSADWAETKGHGHNLDGLEGYPYQVLHYACVNKFVELYDMYKGLKEEEARDVKISAYLTKHATYKPNVPPTIPEQDGKYILFSPFMSQLYNELNLGFIATPTGTITDQIVFELTKNIQWLLKYDPVLLDFDLTYFVVHPCANFGYQPITAQQLLILTKANTLFLKDALRLRGHFEVTP